MPRGFRKDGTKLGFQKGHRPFQEKTAVRPNFFVNFESLRLNKEAQKKGVTEEEQAYYAMSLSEGWKLFNKRAEGLIEEMNDLNDKAIAGGASLEELGRNTIVLSLAKGIVKRLINIVEDAKEACEQPR